MVGGGGGGAGFIVTVLVARVVPPSLAALTVPVVHPELFHFTVTKLSSHSIAAPHVTCQ